MESRIVFLQNVPLECTEEDLYKIFCRFGEINYIKIFAQNFLNQNYPVGYALVQFLTDEAYKNCAALTSQLLFKGNIIYVGHQKPKPNFKTSVFVFFSNDKVDRKYLTDYFDDIKPTDINFVNKNDFTKFGFAIVQFPDVKARDIALGYDSDSSITVIAPDPELIDLSYVGSGFRMINYKPDQSVLVQNTKCKRFFDFEIVHKNTPYLVNRFLAYTYSSHICHLLLSNASLSRVETRLQEEGDFMIIANALNGQNIKVTQQNAFFIFMMAADLGIEFLIKATEEIVFSQLDPDLALDLTKRLLAINIFNGPHVRYLAQNFQNIKIQNAVYELPVNFIATMLNSPYLSINNDNMFSEWLIAFVLLQPEERMRLLQYIPAGVNYERIFKQLFSDPVNINIIRNPVLKILNTRAAEVAKKKKETPQPKQEFALI